MGLFGGVSTHAAAQCSLVWKETAYPAITLPTTSVGYSGSGYDENQLCRPEPIPLGLDGLQDQDQLIAECNGQCSYHDVPGVLTADWEVESNAGATGAFLDSSGARIQSIMDADNVLFLPDTMNQDGTGHLVLKVTVRDLCAPGGLADPPYVLRFTVNVERLSEAIYHVDVEEDLPPLTPLTLPSCEAEPSLDPCELKPSPPAHQDGGNPFAQITRYPSAGMVVGELRMVGASGMDVDRLAAECGTPKGYDPPSGSYGWKEYCDELYYQWSIKPSSVGSGVFLRQGRTAIFRGTSPGQVDLLLTVTNLSGELPVTDDVSFYVADLRLLSVAFGPQDPNAASRSINAVYKDGTGGKYGKPQWSDADGDGEVTTAGVDSNFPVAYPAIHTESLSPSAVPVRVAPAVEYAHVRSEGGDFRP